MFCVRSLCVILITKQVEQTGEELVRKQSSVHKNFASSFFHLHINPHGHQGSLHDSLREPTNTT